MNVEIEKLAAIAERNETSFFQIACFLIGQEPTDQAKLHKCIHEISGRVKSIKSVELELAEIADLAELQSLEMEKLDNSTEGIIKKRMMLRKIHSHLDQMRRLEEKKESWEKEIDYLYQLYKAVSLIEPLKPWGDYSVQMEYWSAKFRNEIKTRSLLNMPIDLETIKAVLALPEEASVKQEMLQLLPQAIESK